MEQIVKSAVIFPLSLGAIERVAIIDMNPNFTFDICTCGCRAGTACKG